MKPQWLARVAVAASVTAGSALAADGPLKVPPPVAAAWNWSGFYIGGHGGYGWGHDPFTDINGDNSRLGGLTGLGFDPKGILGGVHAGANWQTGKIGAGLEADLTWTDAKGSSQIIANTSNGIIANSLVAANSASIELLGSGRARLGYLASPDVLLYGTGGVAWTRFVQNSTIASTDTFITLPGNPSLGSFVSNSAMNWRVGWAAGAGVEARLFDSNWLARVEYLHYDFGNSGSLNSSNALAHINHSGDLTMDVVRAGISYKFDSVGFASGVTGASPRTLAYKAAPPVALPWTWSGFYLGAHAGYGWASDQYDDLVLLNGVPLSGVNSSGLLGGFQAGRNWQSGAFVGGLELDLSATDIKGSSSNALTTRGTLSQGTQTDRLDQLGSARARAGYLFTPNVLAYATSGLGFGRLVVSQDTVTTGPLGVETMAVTPTWLFGWVAGAGVETRLSTTNWIARLEYLHYDFGRGSFAVVTTLAAPPAPVSTSGHVSSDVIRAGLSYKFDPMGFAGGGQVALPVKAAAAAWSWSGFYIGVHGGYGWGRDPFSDIDILPVTGILPALAGTNPRGFVGGFQAGANWQLAKVVAGMEIDLSASSIKGTSTVTGTFIGQNFVDQTVDNFDLLGSARARLGYLICPDVLLYGTGGLGWTQFEQTMSSVEPIVVVVTKTPSWRFGAVAGAGVEARLWNTNWLARAEYLHYDFGKSSDLATGIFFDAAPLGQSVRASQHLTTDVARVGVDYKFN
jgi:opacity protein-like surface antigen